MKRNDVHMIRLYEGMTQKSFATKYGLAESTVAKIEAGFVGISDVTRAKILRQFDMSEPEYIAFCERMKQAQENEVKNNEVDITK